MRISRSCLAVTVIAAGSGLRRRCSLHGNQDRRRPAHTDQRRLALLQRRSGRRRAARFQRCRLAALDLPHDWAIEGPFDRKFNPHDGGLPFFGIGWYRKHFTCPASAKGKYFSVEFDGAMSNSTVWLNGQKLGGRPYGYDRLRARSDAASQVRRQENVLAVRLAPEDQSSRWYPGAGIYRNVWLDVTGAGARRALGHLRHHPAGHATPRPTRGHPHRSGEQGRQEARRHGGNGDSRCRGQAGRTQRPAT